MFDLFYKNPWKHWPNLSASDFRGMPIRCQEVVVVKLIGASKRTVGRNCRQCVFSSWIKIRKKSTGDVASVPGLSPRSSPLHLHAWVQSECGQWHGCLSVTVVCLPTRAWLKYECSMICSVVTCCVLMRWSNKKRDQMGRRTDRFSLKCFVTGFVINPSETTAHYHDRWRKEGSICCSECRNMLLGSASSQRDAVHGGPHNTFTFTLEKSELLLRSPQSLNCCLIILVVLTDWEK